MMTHKSAKKRFASDVYLLQLSAFSSSTNTIARIHVSKVSVLQKHW